MLMFHVPLRLGVRNKLRDRFSLGWFFAVSSRRLWLFLRDVSLAVHSTPYMGLFSFFHGRKWLVDACIRRRFLLWDLDS